MRSPEDKAFDKAENERLGIEELEVSGEALSVEVQGTLILDNDGRTMRVLGIAPDQRITVLVEEDHRFKGLGDVLSLQNSVE